MSRLEGGPERTFRIEYTPTGDDDRITCAELREMVASVAIDGERFHVPEVEWHGRARLE